MEPAGRAIHGKRGHSDGTTILRDLGSNKRWKRKLFVAACPLKCTVLRKTWTADDLIRMGWVAFHEYKVLAEFKKLIGRYPKYNAK